MLVKHTWYLLRETASAWWEDNVTRLAASLAYYTIFAIAPLLVIAIFIAGALFGQDAAHQQVYTQMRDFVGEPTARAVQEMIRNASKPDAGVVATIIGVVLLIYAATNVFASLQDSLNTIWEVKPDPNASWWLTIRNRLFSFAMVVVIGFLLLVSLVVSTTLSVLVHYVGGSSVIWQWVNIVFFIPIAALLFAMIYKFLPDVVIRWSDVWIGAFVTATLFAIGKWLIGLYLGQSSVTSVYGAAGSLVVLLIWVYYSSLILFFGAEFTQVYARRFGERIEPGEFAVKVTEEDRAQQGLPSTEKVKESAQRKKIEHDPGVSLGAKTAAAQRVAVRDRSRPTLAEAGLLPVSPVPYTRYRAARFPLLPATLASTATGLLLGGVSAYLVKRKPHPRKQSELDRRMNIIGRRLESLSDSIHTLAGRQRRFWPSDWKIGRR